jgi:hypothetical protein
VRTCGRAQLIGQLEICSCGVTAAFQFQFLHEEKSELLHIIVVRIIAISVLEWRSESLLLRSPHCCNCSVEFLR